MPHNLIQSPKQTSEPSGVSRLWHFLLRVFSHFSRNKGFLLASGIAYNMLLSLVPLLAVFLAWVSRVIDRDKLLGIIATELELFVPGQAERLTDDISSFLNHPNLFGGIGLIVLLFFSSLAFRMLQDALEVVFARPKARIKQRSFWLSVALPYIYVAVVGAVLLALTVVVVGIEALAGTETEILGIAVGNIPGIILYVSGIVGEVVLFSSLYRVMPVSKVRFRRALIGGVIATALWEVVRRGLVWWFARMSLVSVVYGSLAAVIIVLLTLEIAAIIVLLSGQVIAELQHSADAGLPWYEAAPFGRSGTTGSHTAVGFEHSQSSELAVDDEHLASELS